MSEGEHTIIGKIPRERLNQIASRKLSALGVPVRLAADRETLEGELAFSGRVVHPATGQPLARGRFVVVGHDKLRFVDPPLASVGELNFYEHERSTSLEQALAQALARHAAALQDVAARMRALRLEAALDPERLAARAVVKTATHAFEILGGVDAVRVSRVAPVGGQPFEVAPGFPPLELSEYASPTDLEIYLVNAVPRMQAAPAPVRAAATPPGAVVATPPPRNALTLAALARVFGEDAILAPNAMVELVQEFVYGNTRLRFVAAREVGTRFKGRLIGPNGDVWADRFELENFPGTRKVVALALGAPDVEAAPEEGAPPAGGGAGAQVPSHLMPHAGEVWVMNVVVEEAGQDEVRYVGTDIDGKPYGAARVLKRSDFEAVFSQERGGWRLLIQIDQVQEGHVIYRQLDRQRQPMGAPRKMSAAILVANFVPEAAAY
ncbi:hypothetical protein [Anaeromyxobacter oryzae]|uniref:Uncharacterized protein n=1 Tax=Anaeromyxobacter oryzae TaxID=2918170 RepID=A0ABM7X404_9BACT|nr:hypothetical protein [Anaeromyxobacter oryzae]BDG06509.1 hypothetical protein AMOR_55050 [Anaeromyxobacter oryzae]